MGSTKYISLEMVTFVQHLQELSGGKPAGFKLCIGHPWEWFAIVKAMIKTQIYFFAPKAIYCTKGKGPR
ncbi:hypothetical protein POPA111323_01595 [Polynucleobacter paneuropaeus]|uniref:Uncharacterized protein n=1 Tax=Polynucleobacter paneuropaeus TaxID=2527775 RepID=A0A2Z4JTA1_9BURK|nr:hypothetical protein Pas1_03300 [Polynucleobacter paneuropaeus]